MDKYKATAEIRKIIKEVEPDDEPEVVFKVLESYLNCMGNRATLLAEQVMYSHRTLQQILMRFFLEVCRLWKETGKREEYDDRNKATVELAKKIVKLTEDEDIYLPFI